MHLDEGLFTLLLGILHFKDETFTLQVVICIKISANLLFLFAGTKSKRVKRINVGGKYLICFLQNAVVIVWFHLVNCNNGSRLSPFTHLI